MISIIHFRKIPLFSAIISVVFVAMIFEVIYAQRGLTPWWDYRGGEGEKGKKPELLSDLDM